jgi:predicted ArsR family transcriptional regulator
VVDLWLATSSRDPLAQATRARLYQLLGELPTPATTAELARRLNLHPNGVRSHLDRMERDGLLRRTRIHQALGRPRDAWERAPDARPGGEPQRAYTDLVRWLARAMRADPQAKRRIERTGRDIGREIAADAPPGATLEVLLGKLGFEPTAKETGKGCLRLTLGNCPYRDAVRENQDVVCTLHRGITRGLLDQLEPVATLDAFVPRDPDRAGCVVEVSGAGVTEAKG